MKVGLVCPYSWDVPGGVGAHVSDLAEQLVSRGHEVSVLAPGERTEGLAPYVVLAGRPIAVPYNGSVARVAFGPRSASRVRRWIREGEFDVMHVHQPASPSLSVLACWAARGPIVATYHMAVPRSRTMLAVQGLLRVALEKVSASIAVSEEARRTVVEHIGGDAVLIPNGVDVTRFRQATPFDGWPGDGGSLGFLGRVDEPRKGLQVLLAALPELLRHHPRLRVLVAGPGDIEGVAESLPESVASHVTFLGLVSHVDKARALHSVDVFVAPHIGGESFGIVLVEAMAAGTPVLASDLTAFRAVLADGAAGGLFAVDDPAALAAAASSLLEDPSRRATLSAEADRRIAEYDWPTVAGQIESVYSTVAQPGVKVREDDRQGPGIFAGRLREVDG